jgi:mRNA-degrading endonuclease RelE of RelBE toxin-antitoxin system
MRHHIVLAAEAIRDLEALKAHVRAAVRDAIERHLRHQPTRTSKSRIRRLRGLTRPQFRLRVGEVRVFYDVSGRTVEILAIVPKSQADRWLKQAGEET